MIIPVLKRIVLKGEIELIDDFVIPADADIGVEGDDGADYFSFKMITPKRLAKILDERRVIDGRATFVVNEQDMESNLKIVESEINKILQDCIRETWDEVAQAINRHLEWEYDGEYYRTGLGKI